MLHENIREEVREAMLAKDTLRLNVVRGILSSFVNELVAQKKKPQETLADIEALKVIKRLANQRKDSIEQFSKGNRNDLVEIEKSELILLQKYLPKSTSKDEILKVAIKKQKELGITNKSDMGKLVGTIMKEFSGNADGEDVKQVVKSLFEN